MIAISTYDNLVDFVLLAAAGVIVIAITLGVVLGVATLYLEIMGRVQRLKARRIARRHSGMMDR